MDKIRTAILGATGVVGQRFVQLISNHPKLELSLLTASDQSAGKPYMDNTKWSLEEDIPAIAQDMKIEKVDIRTLKQEDINVIFCALPATIAKKVELELVKSGFFVSSNTSAYRTNPHIPILIPEVNPKHLDLIESQTKKGWKGKLITNSNCTTSGLVIGLKPLMSYGIKRVFVTTMQALSGAGLPGVPSLTINDNIFPYIKNEEKKIESETLKIMGDLEKHQIKPASYTINTTCTRVPVSDGHLESITVLLREQPKYDELVQTLRSFKGEPQHLKLHSAPTFPIIVNEREDRPQPRLDRMNGEPHHCRGMAVTIGKIKEIKNGYQFLLLVHNTIRGAAGGSILSYELADKKQLV